MNHIKQKIISNFSLFSWVFFLLILLIFPVSVFSQAVWNNVGEKNNSNNTNVTQKVQVKITERQQSAADVINDSKRANAAVAAAMANENIIVRTPITVDLYDYTHIAIVDVSIVASGALPYGKKKWTRIYFMSTVWGYSL